MFFLEGIHYRCRLAYSFLTFLKLREDFKKRFILATSYIQSKDNIVDICAGLASLKDYIPPDCRYLAIEASPEFVKYLTKKGIKTHPINCHETSWQPDLKNKVVVMIISLCQFRDTTAGHLLDMFKKEARRVIIVEDVVKKPRKPWIRSLMNYLCHHKFSTPFQLYTTSEFKSLMDQHDYQTIHADHRYSIGLYENKSQ